MTAEESVVTEKMAPALEEVAAAEQGTGGEAGSEVAAAASASAPAELAGEAAIWQQMTDEASGKPYWSLTRCVLPDERARFPLPLLPQPPHARAPPAAYTVESRVPAACDRGLVRATGIMQRQASPHGPGPQRKLQIWAVTVLSSGKLKIWAATVLRSGELDTCRGMPLDGP